MTDPGTAGVTGPASWWNGISRRVVESDIRRQVRFNRARRAAVQAGSGSHGSEGAGDLFPEYLKALVGSILAFWILTALLARFLHVRPVYALAAFGLVYSLQATYHRYRLAVDPGYRIPGCGCAGRGKDDSETVLRSRESAVFGIPNSVLGALFYPALVLLLGSGHVGGAMLGAVLAVAASAYLARVMIVRIRGLCFTCINIAALNLLIVWQLLR